MPRSLWVCAVGTQPTSIVQATWSARPLFLCCQSGWVDTAHALAHIAEFTRWIGNPRQNQGICLPLGQSLVPFIACQLLIHGRPPPITQIICIGHVSVNPCLWRCFLLGSLLRALLVLPQSFLQEFQVIWVWRAQQALLGTRRRPHARSHQSPQSWKDLAQGFGLCVYLAAFFADEHHIEPSTSARKPKFLAISHDLLALIAKILHGVHEQRKVCFSVAGHFVIYCVHVFKTNVGLWPWQ